MSIKTPIVSILIPTRNRVNKLKASLDSLFKTCYDQSNFEVLCGVDNDDLETIKFLDSYTADHSNVKYYLFEKGGYKNIYKIHNYLTTQSSGYFLFLYSDDTEMESYNWDLVIKEHNGKFIILNPLARSLTHYVRNVDPNLPGYVWFVFPIFPKKLTEITGRIANNTAADSWLSELAYYSKIHILQEDNIILEHYRFDETKNEADIDLLYNEVVNDRNFVQGDFYAEYQVQERIKDIEKLTNYINSFG